jgi:hypothetical protein
MARRGFLHLLFSVLLLTPGCGKKGPIEPPLLRIPQTVEDLAVIQRGSSLLLTWTNPSAYADGNPLEKVAEAEIWMIKEDRKAEGGSKKWTVQEFEGKAKLVVQIKQDEFTSLRSAGTKTGAELSYSYALGEEDLDKKVLTISLRVKDEKERASAFAAPSSVAVVTPPSSPQNVRAVVFGDHIQVSWESPEPAETEATRAASAGINVYRSEEDNPSARLNSSPVKGTEFLDKKFSFGRTYRYFARAVLESAPLVESDDSETAEVLAKDIFPPEPPVGVTAIGGPGYIALSWEGARESDLAGYRVWRRLAGETDFLPLARLPQTESSFSDSKVEKGKKYEYAITALDQSGNESRKSVPVPGAAREDCP